MRPMRPAGSPWPLSRCHVRPASRDRYNPSAWPPLVKVHGMRLNCQMPANTSRPDSSCAMSETPLCAPTYSVFVQLLPPSDVRYTPRRALSRYGSPSAPTSAVDGSCGDTRILEIANASSSARCIHVAPPSVETQTPSPYEASLRGFASPVPTQIVLRSDGATASAPIAATGFCPQTSDHVAPPSVVFQTP